MSLSLVLSSILMAAAASSSTPCTPIPGWDEIVADERIHWVILGEVHGSNETPALFADAVCLTAQARDSVVVALEQPSSAQAAIDKFVASDGGEEATREFLEAPMWNGAMKDGRSSQAFFRLFEKLRQMRSAGRVVSIVAFQPVSFTAPPSPGEYEKAMAELVRSAKRTDTTVIALVGNVHAMRTKVTWRGGYLPMAAHLPAEATVTLNVLDRGGETWSCVGQPVVCGPNPSVPSDETNPRGVSLSSDGQAPYSGVLYLGAATTASPPQQSTER